MDEIVFHIAAGEEMQAAAAYYEERARGLGDEFLDEVEHGLRRIQQFPLLWPVYEGEYRRYLLRRFPYGLVYRVEPQRTFIMAVGHLHRKPGYWQDRA